MLEREWVSIRDPNDERLRYTFDVSFLLSNYRCIYGEGCQGISATADAVIGCCAHGAYYTDDDEQRRIEALVDELDPQLMQFHAKAVKKGVTELEDGEAKTRTVKGGCIFLNRADHPGGIGCALHHLAVARGEHHMTYKPTVCWQVPLHRAIEEVTANDGETMEVHTIAAFERGTWGEGGADFGWWCTEEPAAFSARAPVFRSMERELRTMVGDPVYDELARFLAERARTRRSVQFLPVVATA